MGDNIVILAGPFAAVFVILIIVLVAFEIRKRRIRKFMDEGYQFVVNREGRIIAQIMPTTRVNGRHGRF